MKKDWQRFILKVFFFSGLAFIIFLANHFQWFDFFSFYNIEKLKKYILNLGIIAPLFIIFLYFAFSTFFLPTMFFSMLCGYLYGILPGTLLAWIGLTGGILSSFLASRYLFQQDFIGFFGDKKVVLKIEEYLERHDWLAVVALRLFFIFPYNIQNYAYGLSNVKISVYITGSAIGILPITIINAWLGFLVSKGSIELADIQLIFQYLFGAMGMIVILIALFFLIRYFFSIKRRK
ncbi:MAG: VTT domain-containing protein [Spirochaetes bacterium]|nr:VTT domain-containing protein [Spirochaetota bacterium]